MGVAVAVVVSVAEAAGATTTAATAAAAAAAAVAIAEMGGVKTLGATHSLKWRDGEHSVGQAEQPSNRLLLSNGQRWSNEEGNGQGNGSRYGDTKGGVRATGDRQFSKRSQPAG